MSEFVEKVLFYFLRKKGRGIKQEKIALGNSHHDKAHYSYTGERKRLKFDIFRLII